MRKGNELMAYLDATDKFDKLGSGSSRDCTIMLVGGSLSILVILGLILILLL